MDSEPGALPFQWNLLAWAALVGVLSGLAVVAFHELLGFINNGLFGPFIEWLLNLARGSAATLPPPILPLPDLPSPAETGTPLKALLQIGLGGLGFLPPPPAIPQPPAEVVLVSTASLPDWLRLWPVVVVPTLGGYAMGLLRRYGGSLGPGLPSLMAMADGVMRAAPKLPLQRLLGASLSLGSGASLGPEGPSVESGGNIGLWVALRARLTPESQKTLVAAGAVHLARQVFRPLSETVWTGSLAYHSGYREEELLGVVKSLQRLHWLMSQETQELRAVMRKYDRPSKLQVSRISAISEKALRFDFKPAAKNSG
jgi:hypothetical protein